VKENTAKLIKTNYLFTVFKIVMFLLDIDSDLLKSLPKVIISYHLWLLQKLRNLILKSPLFVFESRLPF
jgi:hypothetical protein